MLIVYVYIITLKQKQMKEGIFLKIPKVKKFEWDGMTLEQMKKLYDDEMSTMDGDLNWWEREKLKRLIEELESK